MSQTNLFNIEKINTANSLLKNQAYNLIKAAIIDNRISPNNVYSQGFLSSQLGISRTPVREALLQLQGEGIIHIHRGRGIQVITTSAKDLKDILEMSEALECKVCQLAAERIDSHAIAFLEELYLQQQELSNQKKLAEFMQKDREFHCYLAKTTGNDKLAESVANNYEQLLRSGVFVIYKMEFLPAVVHEHRHILDAIQMRIPESSSDAMLAHMKGLFGRAMESAALLQKQII